MGINIPDSISSTINFKEFKERNILRQNAEKIICHILGSKKKPEGNLNYIIKEFSAFSMDELIYSVFSGKINFFEKSYQSLCNQGKNQITILFLVWCKKLSKPSCYVTSHERKADLMMVTKLKDPKT